ncbi:MAG: hypothetical protein LBV79_10320 [Candidatus Adiutrix sp.]|jgi:hypothetical protein|nr:hypothetical protein [Candidatus Adiutrix sp.]
MSKANFAEYANVSGLIGIIVSRQLATLNEMETVYSLPDALNLAEIITVGNYNEWAAMEASKHGNHS